MMRFGKVFWLGVMLPGLLGFDFWSKSWVRGHLDIGEQISVVPGWLALTHAENPGMAFSLPLPVPVIVTLGMVMVGALAWTWWRLPASARVPSAAIGAILAGALGNLLDRIGDGTVTDMVRLYTEAAWLAPTLRDVFGTATWPIFNVADVALLGGVVGWVVHDAVRSGDTPGDEAQRNQ